MSNKFDAARESRVTELDSSVVSDVLQHAAYNAFQKPLTGISQLVDGAVGSHLTAATEFIPTPTQASFGSARYHAEQIADGVGAFVPLIASAAVSRPVSKLMFEKGLLKASSAPVADLLERQNFAESALTGFTNGVLFQPGSKDHSLIEDRLKSGIVGAATFGTMQVASASLGRLTGASAYENSFLNKMLTTGVAGAGGGIVGGVTDSLLSGKVPEFRDIASSAYSSAFTGAMLGGLAGGFTKMQTRSSELPSVQEFVARDFQTADAQGDYQIWLENQKLSVQLGHFPAAVADYRKGITTDPLALNVVASAIGTGHEQAPKPSIGENSEPVDSGKANSGKANPGKANPERDNSEKENPEKESAEQRLTGMPSAMQKRYRSLQLSELSPLERLNRLEQYEKLGKSWTLNDKSLGDMHDILSKLEKSWDKDMRAKLAENERAAKQAYSDSAETDMNARLDIKVSQNAIATELASRGEQLTNALKPWFESNSMPALTIRFADLNQHGAHYAPGEGIVTIDNSAFIETGLNPKGFGLLYHEIVHGQQDVMCVGLVADKLNIGKVATPEQLDQIKSWNDHGATSEAGMAFVQRVLAVRDGRRFSPAETKTAQRLLEAYDNYDANYDRIAQEISNQLANTRDAARDPADIFALLNDVAIRPDEVKSHLGFESIPGSLTLLAKQVDQNDKSVSFGINETIAQETRQILNAHINHLNGAQRRAAAEGNDKYFGSPLEAQAYPAQIIAELFAKNRERFQATPQ